jgi:DNA topoisomerase-3
VRERKDLTATTNAEDFLHFRKAAEVETLSRPALTGEWEHKVRQMENGSFTPTRFIKEIADLTTAVVMKTTNFVEGSDRTKETSIIVLIDNKPLIESPRCHRS